MDYESQKKCGIKSLLVIGTSLCLILTAFQVIAPIVIVVFGILIIVKIETSQIFHDSQNTLFIIIFLLTVVSFLLLFWYFLQYQRPYNKFVQISRQILDFSFTGLGIAALVLSSKGREEKYYEQIVTEWIERTGRIKKYEENNNCKSLSILQESTTDTCDSYVENDFNSIYGRSRDLRIPLALFWCSMIFYDLISIVVLCFDK